MQSPISAGALPRSSSRSFLRYLALDGAILLALLAAVAGVYAVDSRTEMVVVVDPPPPPDEIPPPPVLEDLPPPEPPPPPPPVTPPRPPADPEPRVAVNFAADARFGVMTLTGNPNDSTDDHKKLTFSVDGSTNNTRVWVDGVTPLYGSSEGSWRQRNAPDGEGGYTADWTFRDVRFEQRIELTAGELSRRTDAVKITYTLENAGTEDREAGLRVMLDTLIGGNDGVPFVVAGQQGLVTSPQSFLEDKVPDAVRALERSNLTDPGVIVDIGLRSDTAERPAKVVLTHWPGGSADWEYDRTRSFGSDTAIGLYYPPRRLGAGETRRMEFSYGLGTISSTSTRNARLSLTAGGPFRSGGQFWLVALVQQPRAGQQVRLTLPDGLSVKTADDLTRPVPAAADFTQVSWLVQIAPECEGEVEVQAQLDPGAISEKQAITVQPRAAKLTLAASGAHETGTPFWVVARVQNSKTGQSVKLALPQGLTLTAGHEPQKDVPGGDDVSQLSWLVTASAKAVGEVELKATLQPDDVEEVHKLTISFRKPRLQLAAKGPFRAGKPFWLTAVVDGAQSGRMLKINLPPGIKLEKGHAAQQAVSVEKDRAQISFLLKADADTVGDQEVAVVLQPDGITQKYTVDVQPPSLIH